MARPLRRRKGFFVRRVWSYLPGSRTKRLEIRELFRVGDRSVSQERRRLRDRLSDDQNAHDLFKGYLGKCNNWRIDPPGPLFLEKCLEKCVWLLDQLGIELFSKKKDGDVGSNATSSHPTEPGCCVHAIHSPSPFNCSGVRSWSHNLPRQRNPFAWGRDVASRSAFECLEPFPWRLHTHSSNLSCTISLKHRASILRPALRDYGGQVTPAYAKASAGKHGA